MPIKNSYLPLFLAVTLAGCQAPGDEEVLDPEAVADADADAEQANAEANDEANDEAIAAADDAENDGPPAPPRPDLPLFPVPEDSDIGAADLLTEVEGPAVEPRAFDLPPPVDGFANPLSPTGFADEINGGGVDQYYNANDWTVGGHCGEDWNYTSGGNTDYGKPVYATANGVVVNAGHYGSGWGNIVMIKHFIPGAGNPNYRFVTSTYAHLADFAVSPGDVVVRGEPIGSVGDADGKYYAHLHFEMRWDHTLSPTANAGYHCYGSSSGTFDPTDFIDSHRAWSPSFDDWGFCTDDEPCGTAEGDCDDDSECLPGSICVDNQGAKYGWSSGVDVCEAQCHSGSLGGLSFCSEECPCGIGEGDCDDNDECLGELICRHNVGAKYGWSSGVDVCEKCHDGTLGDWSYCSPECPCDEGEGDCDSDADCAGNLKCLNNVGPEYGWSSSLDVCGLP